MDSFLAVTGSKAIGFDLLAFYFSLITVPHDFLCGLIHLKICVIEKLDKKKLQTCWH